MGNETNYVSPTGRVVTVADKDRSLYESLGYSPETIEHEAGREQAVTRKAYYERPIEKAQAAVEGVYSGASLGLYDVAMGHDSETARRAEFNPGTRLAGEIVGGMLGMHLPLGKGITSVTRLPGQSVAAKGASAALEGAVYGAGQGVAEARLSGDPLTVETVIHGAGAGALLNFGASLAGSALERRAAKAEHSAAEAVKKEERIAHLESELARHDASEAGVMGPEHKPHWDNFRTSAREAADDLLTQARDADAAMKTVKESGSFVKSAEEGLIKQPPVASPTAEALKSAKAGGTNWLAKSGNMVESVAKDLTNQTTQAAFDWRRPALQDVAKVADAEMARAFKTGDVALARKAADAFFSTAQRAGVTIESGLGALGPEGVASALKAVEEAHVYKKVGKTLNELPANFANMTRNQADKLAAAVERASALSQNGASLKDGADRLMENLGVMHDGTMAERLYQGIESARNARGAKGGKGVTKGPSSNKAAIEKELKELRGDESKETKSKSGRRGLVQRISRFMAAGYGAKALSGSVGGGYLTRAVGAMTGGSLINSLMGGEGLLGSVLSAKSRLGARVNANILKWARPTAAALRRGAPAYAAILRHTALSSDPQDEKAGVQDLAKARIQELDSLIPGLPDHAYSATAWLQDEHPELQAGAQEWMRNAITYMQSVAPKNPGTVVVAGKDRWLPSLLKAKDFADRWMGCFQPVEAGEAYLRGEATHATVQALAACNPGVYSAYRDRMLIELSDPEVIKRLDVHQRSKAAMFTGVPLDGLQDPGAVEFFQQQFATAQANSRVPPSASGSPGRPPGPADAQGALQSQAQRLTYR